MLGERLGSVEFREIGPAAACMADYPEHIAPKSPQKHRLGSIGFQKNASLQACKGIFQNILLPGNFIGHNMAAPRIRLTSVPADLQIRLISCFGGSPDPPERGVNLRCSFEYSILKEILRSCFEICRKFFYDSFRSVLSFFFQSDGRRYPFQKVEPDILGVSF